MAQSAPTSISNISNRARKRRVVGLSLLAAAIMAALKLWAGLASGSLGVLSDAVHTGLDLVASVIVLASITVSDRPADETHAYGHGKMENLAAFTETLLMIAAMIWIVAEAIGRMVGEASPLRISIWPFLVLVLSMVVDTVRSRALYRVAHDTRSQAVEADALNFSMDVWSSFAVLCGLLAGAASEHWSILWLHFGDPLAALVVAAFILKACWRLARQTVDVLTDAAPVATRRRVIDELEGLPGILDIERLRLRVSGSHYFADLTVGMARTLSFQRAEQLKEDVAAAVRRVLPEVDVVVNVVPRTGRSESIFDRVRAVAARRNLSVHDLSVRQHDSKLHLEQHLELPEKLSLREAHDLVTELEGETRVDVPEIGTILTHIESEHEEIENEDRRSEDAELEYELRRIAAEFPNILDVHDVVVSNTHDHIQISCHCTLPDDLDMSSVHTLITTFEDRVKLQMPQISRVLIHPEPATDNAR